LIVYFVYLFIYVWVYVSLVHTPAKNAGLDWIAEQLAVEMSKGILAAQRQPVYA
jgi:hypothetical protein